MPIYAYKCASCGHAKDVLQKMSDPPLAQCPACGAQAFSKQVTAAGFQLKGSGWYATDFKGGAQPAAAPAGDKGADAADAPKTADAKPADGATPSKPADAKPAVTAAKPADTGGSTPSSGTK